MACYQSSPCFVLFKAKLPLHYSTVLHKYVINIYSFLFFSSVYYKKTETPAVIAQKPL